MKSVFILIDSLFQLYLWIVIINAILGWLVTFNIINTSNRFVYSLIEFSYRLTEPVLRKIRMVLPIIASIDFSPVVLVLGLIIKINKVQIVQKLNFLQKLNQEPKQLEKNQYLR